MPTVHPRRGPGVSIIVPAYDRLELTQRCVARLHATLPPGDWELVVVDDGSSDGTGPWLEAKEADGLLRAVHHPYNRGFAAACNSGAAIADGDVFVLLNNDTEVWPGWLPPLLAAVQDEAIGAAGSRLLFPNGRIQHHGYLLGETADGLTVVDPDRDLHDHDSHFVRGRRHVPAVSAASMAVRRDVWVAMDGFDEGYVNGYEDVDLCLRLAQKGLAVVLEPASVAVHLEGASGPARWANEVANLRRFRDTWTGRLPVTVERAAAA